MKVDISDIDEVHSGSQIADHICSSLLMVVDRRCSMGPGSVDCKILKSADRTLALFLPTVPVCDCCLHILRFVPGPK